MNEIKIKIENPNIKLKQDLYQNDYDDINRLKELCLQEDKTSLKLEIDYKLNKIKENSESINNINEFMFYNGNNLIGYIGVNQFGGGDLEVNGMVHPEYRRKGYGREILIMAIERLKEKNPNEIMLQVDVQNKNALELYKYCGFEETSTMEYYKLSNKKI